MVAEFCERFRRDRVLARDIFHWRRNGGDLRRYKWPRWLCPLCSRADCGGGHVQRAAAPAQEREYPTVNFLDQGWEEVREEQFWARRFSRNRRKGHAIKALS